jgi:hypothetical protein
VNGPVAVCFTCGRPYYVSGGHACTGRPQDAATASDPRDRTLAVAATLPDGTPHPDPFLAQRGWIAWHGCFIRAGGGGDDGEEAAA